MNEQRQRLQTKFEQAFSENWDSLRPTKFEIFENQSFVGVRLLAMDSNEEWHIIHEEPAAVLANSDDVDEMLSRALSIFLMEHPRWPK